MAELIPIEDISTLKSASEVREVAKEAESLHTKAAVARLINLAANTGLNVAIWEHPMDDTIKTLLEGQGYAVTKVKHSASRDSQYRIEWN